MRHESVHDAEDPSEGGSEPGAEGTEELQSGLTMRPEQAQESAKTASQEDPFAGQDATKADVTASLALDLAPFGELSAGRPADLVNNDPLHSLVTDSIAGDEQSVRRLLRALAPQMRGVCHSILGPSHPDVEDTAQECFIAVVRALAGYRFEGEFSHYAIRIAVRTAMTARRRSQQNRSRFETRDPTDEPVARSASPSDEALAYERKELLRRLLDELPETQAEALTMRVVFGLSMEEIASATSVPFNTVKTRIRLAKGALRKKIANDAVLSAVFGRVG